MEDFSAYFVLLYSVISLVTFFGLLRFIFGQGAPQRVNNLLIFVILFSFLLLFGLRGEDVGSDTFLYIRNFQRTSFLELSYENVKDPVFYFVGHLVNLFTDNYDVYLLVISFLYVFPIYLIFKKINSRNSFIIVFFIVSMFFFKSMGINILRQGLSVSFLALGSLLYLHKKNKWGLVFISLSILFHLSAIIPIAIFIISRKIKNFKIPLFIYIFSIVASYLEYGILSLFLKIPFLGERIEGYVDYSDNILKLYETGFRLDFVVFNTFFLVIAFFLYKSLKDRLPTFYKKSLIIYMLCSSFFFLTFQFPYNDRFGIYSWALIPLLISPVLEFKQKRKFYVMGLYILSNLIFLIFNF